MGFSPITFGAAEALIAGYASGYDHATKTGDNTFDIYFKDGSKVSVTIPGASTAQVESIVAEYFDAHKSEFVGLSDLDGETIYKGADGKVHAIGGGGSADDKMDGVTKSTNLANPTIGLYNCNKKAIDFSTNDWYQHTVVDVEYGKTYYISGRAHGGGGDYAFITEVNASGNRVSKIGTEKQYTDYEYTPTTTEVTKIYVNGSSDAETLPTVKLTYIETDFHKAFDNDYEPIKNGLEYENNNLLNRLNKLENSNHFAYSKLGKGCVTIFVDDCRHDLDLVASIFEEYGYPINIACVPENINKNQKANGLTTTKGSYTKAMSLINVCKKIVELGGEVFCHSVPVITEETENDYEFMHTYFVERKQYLESLGFEVRGLIKAGGSTAIRGDDTILSWIRKYYDYADFGGTYDDTHPQYAKTRSTLGNGGSIANAKTWVDNCETRKSWLSLFFHTLDGTESGMNEANLREFLTYLSGKNVDVLVYSEAHDRYSSTVLEERIKALENA